MRSTVLLALALFACKGADTPGLGTGDPSSDTDATGSGTTAGTTAGTAPTFPIPAGWQRVDLDGGARESGVDASIAPDGTIYVSWVDTNDDLYAALSVDGGNSFEAPSFVASAGAPALVGNQRKPFIHAGPDGVYISFVTMNPSVVHLYTASSGSVDFSRIDIDRGQADAADYAKVATDANGDAWLTWVGYVGADVFPTMARESNGWATEPAGNLPTNPCECCQNQLMFTSTGTGILLFRNNAVPLRDIWSMRAAPGSNSFSQNIQVSQTGWSSYICPMQGPRMAELGNGDLIATWTDPTTGPWQAWTTKSTDDGLSWSGDTRPAQSLAGDQRSPNIAAVGTTVWLSLSYADGFTLLESTDSGVNFSELTPLNAGGTNIPDPTLETGAGLAIVVGANASGEVAFQRLQ